MSENNINEPVPGYWDGESTLFVTDSKTGNVHVLKPVDFDIDEWYEERKQAVAIRKADNA